MYLNPIIVSKGFNSTSFVVVQGIESVCSKCPLLQNRISALERKCESLQQQKSQLEVEKNKLEAEKKVFTAEHECMKRAIEFENQGRSQVFIGGGASWGHINLSKKFSAKIDKTL